MVGLSIVMLLILAVKKWIEWLDTYCESDSAEAAATKEENHAEDSRGEEV